MQPLARRERYLVVIVSLAKKFVGEGMKKLFAVWRDRAGVITLALLLFVHGGCDRAGKAEARAVSSIIRKGPATERHRANHGRGRKPAGALPFPQAAAANPGEISRVTKISRDIDV